MDGQGACMQRSDDELVAKCLAGSDVAFREPVERHQNRIYGLALRMMGNPADAEDIAQEAFIRAYAALPRYRPAGGFGLWLCRIATNLCLNAIRDRKRTTTVDPAEIADLHPGAEEAVPSEQSQAIHEAVQSLDESYRAVVVLRFVEGLSYEEIAAALRVPVSTVETRLYRAKKRLRELLKEWV